MAAGIIDMPCVKIGPKGYNIFKGFKRIAYEIHNMPLRSTDVFGGGYPRSGTTWCQELIWLISNDLDFEASKTTSFFERFWYLESSMFSPFTDGRKDSKTLEEIAALPSPRFLKTHLPLSLLPPSLLDTAKMVYVARDPRDVAVSNYNFKINTNDTDFKQYWDRFMNDESMFTPFFENVKEAWEQRHNPNMLFLFYDEMLEDFPAVSHRIAKFLGKDLTEDQVSKLQEHLRIDNLRNKATMYPEGKGGVPIKDFIRKGTSGGWRDYFDQEMALQAERWIADNTRGTGIDFQHKPSISQ